MSWDFFFHTLHLPNRTEVGWNVCQGEDQHYVRSNLVSRSLNNLQLSPSRKRIFCLSLACYLNWEYYVSSATKHATSRLGVLCPLAVLTKYKGFVLCTKYVSLMGMIYWYCPFRYSDICWSFHLICSAPPAGRLQPISSRSIVAFLSIFYQYFHDNCCWSSSELANYVPQYLQLPGSS